MIFWSANNLSGNRIFLQLLCRKSENSGKTNNEIYLNTAMHEISMSIKLQWNLWFSGQSAKKCHKPSLVSQIIEISQWISQIVLLFLLFFLTRICKWWKKKCICAQTHWAHSSAIVSSKWEGWNITACIKNHVGWLVALGLVGHTG